MVKKIFFLALLSLSIVSFSQNRTIDNLVTSPNPFDNSTTITFDSNHEQDVFLIVRNVLGKTVSKKAFHTTKGKKSIVFERENLKSGMYIYAIQSNQETISKRFVIK